MASSSCIVACRGLQSIRDECSYDPCLVVTRSHVYCCPYSMWRVSISLMTAMFFMFVMAVFVRHQRRAAERAAYENGFLAGHQKAVHNEPLQGVIVAGSKRTPSAS